MTPYLQKLSAFSALASEDDAPEEAKQAFGRAEVFPDFHARMRSSGLGILRADVFGLLLSFLGGVVFMMARQSLENKAPFWGGDHFPSTDRDFHDNGDCRAFMAGEPGSLSPEVAVLGNHGKSLKRRIYGICGERIYGFRLA